MKGAPLSFTLAYITTTDWRWKVQIRGALSDLEHLARHFTSAHASVFRDERDGSYLYLYHSQSFDDCETSEKVAGDTARHGKEHEQPPSNPMTLEEAIAYVNYVLHAWFASKGA